MELLFTMVVPLTIAGVALYAWDVAWMCMMHWSRGPAGDWRFC